MLVLSLSLSHTHTNAHYSLTQMPLPFFVYFSFSLVPTASALSPSYALFTSFPFLNFSPLSFSHLSRIERRALVYLSAAVSDFYIPFHEMPTHKIQSRESTVSPSPYLTPFPSPYLTPSSSPSPSPSPSPSLSLTPSPSPSHTPSATPCPSDSDSDCPSLTPSPSSSSSSPSLSFPLPGLSVHLSPSPKMMGFIREEVCVHLYVLERVREKEKET